MKKSTLSMMAGITGILTGMGLASYAMTNPNSSKSMKKVKNLAEDVADEAKDLANDIFDKKNCKGSCH